MLLAKDGIANSSNPDTGVAVELLEDVAHKVFAPKELASLTLHKDIAKLLQTRLTMVVLQPSHSPVHASLTRSCCWARRPPLANTGHKGQEH